jgi:hypothetical protein
MNLSDINHLPTILDENIVRLVHEKLIKCSRWSIATDNVDIDLFQKGNQATDSGMIVCSYETQERNFRFSSDNNDDTAFRELNFYADLILDLCLQKCYDNTEIGTAPVFKNVEVIRYFWNYYHQNSKGTIHIDSNETNHWSIVFYLNHCPNSGTVIIDAAGNQVVVPHVPGNAVMFPSTFKHKGLSPEENNHRCCLNILFKADRIRNIVHIDHQTIKDLQ